MDYKVEKSVEHQGGDNDGVALAIDDGTQVWVHFSS